MSARGRMTMRAHVQRNAASVDKFGRPDPNVWYDHDAAMPCLAHVRTGRDVIDVAKIVTWEDWRIMFPKSADIHEADRIMQVRDRSGRVVVEGPLTVKTVVPKVAHLEALVEVVAA